MVFKMLYDKMKSFKMFKCDVCGWCIHFVCFLILLALTKDGVKAQELREPASDFSHHRIVQPIVHHGRTKREISSTKDESGAHHPAVIVTVPVDGEEYVLELRLNDELVTDNHVVSYQMGDKTVQRKPNIEELDICQYSGSVRGKPGSWVAVSTCHGVRGVIYDGTTLRYIEPAQGGGIQNRHYLYDHRHLATEFTCGYRGGVTNNTEFDPMLLKEHLEEKEIKKSRVSRHKRSSSYEDTQVRGPFNANKLSRYVELVLVADHREFLANREDMAVVHHQMKDVANIINAMYTPLNIFIALVGVVVWSERDEIDLEEDGDKTLTNFLQYRKQLSLRMPNDNAQLLTRQKFNDGVVGKGLKGPMCTYEFSGAVSTNHSTVIGLVAATIAHEMGHNFGMEHDTVEDCECPDDKCIMSPSSTAVVPVHWSSCSLKSLAVAFEKGMDYCLRNKPKKLYASPTCGNGFVEAGEQCDCGVPLTAAGGDAARAQCEACCRADTCTLRENATCATGQCCDLKTCRPRPAGTVCRAAERECDLPEYCAGHSEHCPPDVHRADGAECARGGGGAAGAYCAGGACRSHTDQCRLLWGTTGQDSSDRCYAQNTKGDINGNCGYSRTRSVFAACAPADARCGLLQCRHLNERLEFGMESVSTLSQMFINSQGSIIPCRTAIIDLGLNDVDPGLVPDGAKCGDDKMCMNQKCVPVELVRQQISLKESSVCPSNCSGHGVCNSEGHCHCDVGFAPPLCELPGTGGSVDSGPASDPSVQRNFMVTMYIIFLGIIPAVLLVMFLGYYSRQNVLWFWARPNKPYVCAHGWRQSAHLNTRRFKLFKTLNCTDTACPADTHCDKANSGAASGGGNTYTNIGGSNTKNSRNNNISDGNNTLNASGNTNDDGINTNDTEPVYDTIDESSGSSKDHLDVIYQNTSLKHIFQRKALGDKNQYKAVEKSKCKDVCISVTIKPDTDESDKKKGILPVLNNKSKNRNNINNLNRFNRKLKKEDIKVVDSKDLDLINKASDTTRPVMKDTDAAKSSKESKPKLEIVKTGLMSTTNEMISGSSGGGPRVYSIRKSGLYESGKDVKVHSFHV